MLGGRYQQVRYELGEAIQNSGGKAQEHLRSIRDALDGAMEKTAPGISAMRDKYRDFQLVRDIVRDPNQQLTPQILKDKIIADRGAAEYANGKGLAGIAQAGEKIIGRPPPKEGPGRLARMAGGAGGLFFGEQSGSADPAVWGIFGHEYAPDIAGLAQAGGRPLARAAYFNPMVQALLRKGSALAPPPGTQVSPAVARYLLTRTTGPAIASSVPEQK
jgi:hypothetical protein